MKYWITVATVLLMCSAANAGFQRWSTETEDDPFSGGKKVTASFMVSVRSGVIIFCDTAEKGIEVRAIPGFEHGSELVDFSPTASFAIDGKLLFDADGTTGAVGNNLAAVSIKLDASKTDEFVKAFTASKKQIAIKDGISDRPHLLAASGSTKSGQVLKSCIDAQKN